MPRKKHDANGQPRPQLTDLVNELASELTSSREGGQPLVDEEHYPTGLIRVQVLWDKWDHVPHEDRSSTILRAYELTEGGSVRDRVALAVGLTVAEAYASGLLPVQILPAVRNTDPVTLAQCRQAMVGEGASTLLDPCTPHLRFASEAEAEDCRRRLIQRLPESEPVWVIVRDPGRVDDWALADSV